MIVTGWIGGAAAFAYAAGKHDAEREAARDEQLTHALDTTRDLAKTITGVEGAPGGTAE